MITIESGNGTDLAKVASGVVAKTVRPLTVGQLELAILARYPREDALEWDRTGLAVGDPAAAVTGVAVALDPTRAAVEAAQRAGANVLLTHHPVFIEPPERFSPSYEVASAAGVTVWTAASKGIALMNFHTALDVSVAATRLFPRILSLDFERVLVLAGNDPDKGYGMLCSVGLSDAPFKLAHLAARCMSVFGRTPRVWGDASRVLERIVIGNGGANDVVAPALEANADCLVCGEVKYHAALAAAEAGMAIVEVGHDVSEFPLTALLAQAAIDAGVEKGDVTVVDQSGNWFHHDSTRL